MMNDRSRPATPRSHIVYAHRCGRLQRHIRRRVACPRRCSNATFTYACTDGGYTGASLALVSRFFYHASYPTRFLSLAFASLRQVDRFLACTTRHRTSTNSCRVVKVHHLLLSFSCAPSTDSSADISLNDNTELAASGPIEWFRARQLREQEKAAWDRRFRTLVPRLLDFVAPHLETLAILQSDAFAIPSIRCTLPRLRELTLLVGITAILNEEESDPSHKWTSVSLSPKAAVMSPPHFTPPTISTITSSLDLTAASSELRAVASAATTLQPATRSSGDGSARFPALERLHIVCGRHRDWTLRGALVHLPWLAPALTHLRISNATYTHGSHDCISAFLRGALASVHPGLEGDTGCERDTPEVVGTIERGPRSDLERALAMRGLRRIVVHSVPPPRGGQGGPYKDYRALVDGVKAAIMTCERTDDVRMTWVEGERARHQIWEEEIRAQWVDRIEGGGGCWVT